MHAGKSIRSVVISRVVDGSAAELTPETGEQDTARPDQGEIRIADTKFAWVRVRVWRTAGGSGARLILRRRMRRGGLRVGHISLDMAVPTFTFTRLGPPARAPSVFIWRTRESAAKGSAHKIAGLPTPEEVTGLNGVCCAKRGGSVISRRYAESFPPTRAARRLSEPIVAAHC